MYYVFLIPHTSHFCFPQMVFYLYKIPILWSKSLERKLDQVGVAVYNITYSCILSPLDIVQIFLK